MGRVHKKKIAQYNKENGEAKDGALDNSTNGDEKSSDRSRADSDAEESIASSKKRTPKSTPIAEDEDEEEQIDDIDRSDKKKNDSADEEEEKDDEAEPEANKSSPSAKKTSQKRKSAPRSKADDEEEDGSDDEANGATPAKKSTVKKNAGKKAKAKPKSKKSKPETEDEADEGGEDEKEGDDDEEPEEYEVKDVVDHKTEKGVSYYLIRWKGYGPNDDTWEEEATLSCQDLIDKFNKKKKGAAKTPKAKPASKKGSNKKGSVKKDSEDPEKQWEVDKIIDYSEEKKGRVFRIRWKGYSAKFDTWEPEDNLNCDDLIEKFIKKMESQKDVSVKELREEPKKTKRMLSEGFLKAEKGARKSKRGGGKRIQYADSD